MSKVIAVGACLLLVVGPLAGLGVAGATANERPLPDAGLDQTVQRGATVVLDAGGSRDPDGNVTDYRWRIEAPNGTTFAPDDAGAVRTSFVASRTGEYAATVEVTDDDGGTATDTLYVTVEAPPDGPAVSLSGDTRPTVDAAAGYSATATAGDAELETLTWSVDGREVADQSVAGNDTTRSIRRSFDDASPRTVRVTVRDENGRTASASVRVDPVSPDPPEPDDTEPDPTPTPTPDPTPSPDATTTPTATVTPTPDACSRNEPPTVDASAEFGGSSRGDSVTISATVSDPDGEVVSVDYSPSRIIPAPAPGEMTTVRVTATDDCRVLGTDTLVLSGEEETYRAKNTKQSQERYEIRLFYYNGAGGADPYKSEIMRGDRSKLPPIVSGEVDTHREEQAVVDAETWSVYRDHSPADAVKENEGPDEATEAVTTNTTTTTETTTRTVEVIGDERMPDAEQSGTQQERDDASDSRGPAEQSPSQPALSSGNGKTVSASEVTEGAYLDDETGGAQPEVGELQDQSDVDGDGHEVDERANDPNDDGEVETGLGWTVDADGHNT